MSPALHPATHLCQMASSFFQGTAWIAHPVQRYQQCTNCNRMRLAPADKKESGSTQGGLCSVCTAPRMPATAPPLPLPSSSSLLYATPNTVSDAEVLKELGISLATLRQLRQLEDREVTPNDYDLLLRLHEKPSTKTRERPGRLNLVARMARARACVYPWPIAIPGERALSSRDPPDRAFPPRPVARAVDDATIKRVSTTFVATRDETGQCAVCLCAMVAGEELTQLACEGEHVFHARCIREWLGKSSTCCPVDQQDLPLLSA